MSAFIEWVDGVAVLYWNESTDTIPATRQFLENYVEALNAAESWKKQAIAAEKVADELAAVVAFADTTKSFSHCIASNWIEKVLGDYFEQKEERVND